jgi:hypothetical protein
MLQDKEIQILGTGEKYHLLLSAGIQGRFCLLNWVLRHTHTI